MQIPKLLLRSAAPFLCALALTASATLAQATIIYDGESLPGDGTAPDGDITWFTDSQVGQCFQVRVLDNTGQTSERAEFTGGRGGLQNGMTVYFGWRSRYVGPTPNVRNVMFQLKCHGTHVADQPLVFEMRNGTLALDNHEDINGAEVSRQVWSRPLEVDKWFEIILKVHYSEDRSVGYCQLWYNGVQQTLNNGTTIHHGQTWDGSENNCHWGIYRGSSISGTAYHYIQRPRIATTFDEAAPEANVPVVGNYKLIARHSSKAVVVQSASTADGANVIQWGHTTSTPRNDEWNLIDIGSGYRRVMNRHSNKAMNVSGGSTANGGDVIQWPYSSTAPSNDEWKFEPLGGGYFRIVNRHSLKVLNVSGASVADGANVDQWSWANVNQQQFRLIRVP